jgi:hypothetical protein
VAVWEGETCYQNIRGQPQRTEKEHVGPTLRMRAMSRSGPV